MNHTPTDPVTAVRLPAPERVGLAYDALADRHALHHGYWPAGYRTDTSTTSWHEAADQLTDLAIGLSAVRAGSHLLDLGCGNGQPALRAVREVGARVTGITVNPRHRTTAAEAAEAAGLADRCRFELVDGTRMPYADGSFDAVWALQSLVQIADQAAALREVRRVLTPAGRLVVADIVTHGELPEQYEAAWTGTTAHTVETLTALVRAAGFEILRVDDVTTRTRCVVSWHVDELVRQLGGLTPDAAGAHRARYLDDVAVRHGTDAADLLATVAEYRHHPDYARDEASLGYAVLVARKANL